MEALWSCHGRGTRVLGDTSGSLCRDYDEGRRSTGHKSEQAVWISVHTCPCRISSICHCLLCVLGGCIFFCSNPKKVSQVGEKSARTSRVAVSSKLIGLITCFYMPGSLVVFLAFAMYEFRLADATWGVIFIPTSQGSVSSLDQAVALATSVMVLLYSLWSAYQICFSHSRMFNHTLSNGVRVVDWRRRHRCDNFSKRRHNFSTDD
jgi:hypothetical protein